MQAPEINYGSDPSGLVWGFLFGSAGAASTIDAVAAQHWIADPARRAKGEFIWLHFNLSNAASEKWLNAHASLSDEFYETLHQGSRSTRIELADDMLIAVVNDVKHDFSFEPSDISTLWLSVSETVVISARRTPLQSIEHLRQAALQGEAFESSVELLTHLLRDQADVLIDIVRKAVKRVDQIEDTLLAGRTRHKREDLGAMRRVLVRLRRLLAPEPAALFRLLQRPPAWMDEQATQGLRQSTEEFSVVLNDMSSLQERIKLLQEEIAAHVNEENGRSLFVLTIVTVLVLPINVVAGLLGMNVGGVPLTNHPNGFWIIVAIVFVVTVIAGAVLLRLPRKN